jgi:hypothetical protein
MEWRLNMVRGWLSVVAVVTPLMGAANAVSAQTLQESGGISISDAQVQMLMQQAEGIRECVKQVDAGGFAALNKEGYQVQQDVKALCKSGDRDQAQYEAVRFANKAKTSSVYQAMQQCTSPALTGIVLQMIDAAQQTDAQGKPKVHVCDHIKDIAAQNR